MFVEVRRALPAGRERFGFRLVHFSVQRDPLHLLAEAENRRALSRGVQGLAVRVARAVNRRLRRRGRVFADRYHARALKTPRAARWALRYVLLNVRKHEPGAVPSGFVDGCSSAAWFNGFARVRYALDSPVVAPRTWLLTVGQERAGPFDVDDMPGGP